MFTSEVDKVKYPEIQQRFRFELQGADADRQTRETDSANGTQTTTAQDAATQTAPTATAQDAAAWATSTTAKPASVETHPETVHIEVAEEEPTLDPLVLEFLDADSYEQKLNILAGLHHRITDEMITTMAIACDIEVNDGETEERYEELKNCLLTMEKFECNRLR